MAYTVQAHIHSLNGQLADATILEKVGDNKYIAEFGGVKCSAIFNFYNGTYYVDDKYGIIRDRQPVRDEPCK